MASPRLPAPLRDLLDERLPEQDIRRVWNGLEAKRVRAAGPQKRPWYWSVSAGVAAFACVLALVLWSLHVMDPGPLRLVNGGDVPQHVDASGPTVALNDGSRVSLGASARLDLLESTGRSFSLALRHGEALFDVHPGGPRIWRIECGPVTVEVVGTRFTVVRDEARVRVSVERGAVLVSGPPVPDHVVRLGPRQSIVVQLSAPATATASAQDGTSPASAASTPSLESSPNAPSRIVRAPAVDPAASATSSTSASAQTELPPQDFERVLATADAARVAGRYGEAADILERLVTEQAGDRRASLAEFSLGRLYLESLGNPSRAATHLSRAVARGLPGALAEDAEARLVEALARAGDAAAAHEVADRYRAQYPDGRRRNTVNRWSPPAR